MLRKKNNAALASDLLLYSNSVAAALCYPHRQARVLPVWFGLCPAAAAVPPAHAQGCQPGEPSLEITPLLAGQDELDRPSHAFPQYPSRAFQGLLSCGPCIHHCPPQGIL